MSLRENYAYVTALPFASHIQRLLALVSAAPNLASASPLAELAKPAVCGDASAQARWAFSIQPICQGALRDATKQNLGGLLVPHGIHLFMDMAQVIAKRMDDFHLVVTTRVSAHLDAEKAKEDAMRAQLAAQEKARADAAIAEAARVAQAAADKQAAAAVEAERQRAAAESERIANEQAATSPPVSSARA